mgnify:CR=1 FL=1
MRAARSGRPGEVLGLLRGMGVEPYCLRLTASGHPEHPLRLPLGCGLVRFDESLAIQLDLAESVGGLEGTIARSDANAGVIAPGYVTPWAAPGMPAKPARESTNVRRSGIADRRPSTVPIAISSAYWLCQRSCESRPWSNRIRAAGTIPGCAIRLPPWR